MNTEATSSRIPSSPVIGEDGIRVIKTSGSMRVVVLCTLAVVAFLLLAVIAYRTTFIGSDNRLAVDVHSSAIAGQNNAINSQSPNQQLQRAQLQTVSTQRIVNDPKDPTDIANYINPDDPVPTMAELIDGLHSAGIRTGIGAFNPPGTSPPLQGLAVPDDYVLPEGYVRHHQVTDDGQDIEPILMYSPDHQFFDSHGRPIAVPENRVVPPELAPPGLPIRRVRIPPPR